MFGVYLPQHFLNFFLLPHGQRSFLPILGNLFFIKAILSDLACNSTFLSICCFSSLSRKKFGCHPFINLSIIKLSAMDDNMPAVGKDKPIVVGIAQRINFVNLFDILGLRLMMSDSSCCVS